MPDGFCYDRKTVTMQPCIIQMRSDMMLICPKCSGGMYVKETRTSDTECIRVRVCNQCGRYMFTSEKEVDYDYGENMLRKYANARLKK